MKVSEWLDLHPKKLEVVHPDCSVEEIIDRMLALPGLRDIYVSDPAGTLIGHIHYHRVASMLLAEHRPEHTRRQLFERISCGNANEIMNSHFVTAKLDDDLEDILHHQLDHYIHDMPIISREGKPVGAINLAQVLARTRAQMRQEE